MLGFNQDEYLISVCEIIVVCKQVEIVVDDIYDSGCSVLFFVLVGGFLVLMMVINEFVKELISVLVYFEQVVELIYCGYKKLNKDVVVVMLFKFGDIKELVVIVEWCKVQGICVVVIICYVDLLLVVVVSWYILMCYKNGVEYEYMLLYWLFFCVIFCYGEFVDYV